MEREGRRERRERGRGGREGGEEEEGGGGRGGGERGKEGEGEGGRRKAHNFVTGFTGVHEVGEEDGVLGARQPPGGHLARALLQGDTLVVLVEGLQEGTSEKINIPLSTSSTHTLQRVWVQGRAESLPVPNRGDTD